MITSISLTVVAIIIVTFLIGVVSGWHCRSALAPLDRADDGGPPL